MHKLTLFAFAVLCLSGRAAELSESQAKLYKEANLNVIVADPKDYNNDKVQYTARYGNFTTNLPAYLEKNGFKSDKYYLITAGSLKLPIIAKKTDELKELLSTVRGGATVRVYGKIKDFRHESNARMLPTYYLELKHMDAVQEAAPATVAPGKGKGGFGKKPRRR
jgi:hypothetical protein